MRAYEVSHFCDRELLRKCRAELATNCSSTASLLAYLAEIDARRLYLPAGFTSMYEYCVHEFGLPEDAAYKHIRAARTARKFPAIFPALAEGRLHLSAVVMLTPHMTPKTADELIAAATRRSKTDIERMLAQRFPRTELLPMVSVVHASAPRSGAQLAPGPVEQHASKFDRAQLAPGPVRPPAPRAKMSAIAPRRYALHLTMDQGTHEKLCHAQALLSHAIPSGDLAQVLDRVLDLALGQLEKRKFAATTKPRAARTSTRKRHVPAHVKRAVWERDAGQCTFVGESGHRCGARKFLQFDHVVPVARGGEATMANIQLRCSAHNQLEAERTFGDDFMDEKRAAARRAAEEARAQSDRDVLAALRTLGFGVSEAKCAAALCQEIPDASLEERVRRALTHFRPRARTYSPALSTAGAP